jgi:hypothetical protein
MCLRLNWCGPAGELTNKGLDLPVNLAVLFLWAAVKVTRWMSGGPRRSESRVEWLTPSLGGLTHAALRRDCLSLREIRSHQGCWFTQAKLAHDSRERRLAFPKG